MVLCGAAHLLYGADLELYDAAIMLYGAVLVLSWCYVVRHLHCVTLALCYAKP